MRGVARPAGLEPAAYGFEVRRSIQLSYGRSLVEQLLVGPTRPCGVSKGIRTPDSRNHNPVLYHLSYAHHTSYQRA